MTGTIYAQRTQELRAQLYRMAYCYVKNEQDALDIVSEAVYRGYRKRDSLRDPALFSTWLTRIVINCALDHCRAEKSLMTLEDAADAAAPESDLSAEERLDLYHALDALPPQDKTIIILKYFRDLRFSDIASLLNIPENTAKTRLYATISRLRVQLMAKEEQTDE